MGQFSMASSECALRCHKIVDKFLGFREGVQMKDGVVVVLFDNSCCLRGVSRSYSVTSKDRRHLVVGHGNVTDRFISTARCTIVQSAVLRSHVVCLSV